MSTLQYQILQFIQHLEAVEVKYTHSDLHNALAQIIVTLPKDADERYLDGEALAQALLSHAPSRDWFEAQELKLNGQTPAVENLPEVLRQLAPVREPGRAVEWFETVSVLEPQIVDGRWCKPVEIIDLRQDAHLDLLKTKLKARLADVRFAHETSGVSVEGATVKTDRESQATITGAYARASTEPATTVQWKAENGFVNLDAAAIKTFGTAVFNHVQSCFARERVLLDQINEAGDMEALMAVDILGGW